MENNTQQQSLQLPEEDGVDIKKYIFLILSHWWWFGISVFVSLTLAYLVNRYSQRIYSSSASLIIGEEKSGSNNIENLLDELTRSRKLQRKAVVENEISILKSYKMARLALEELDFGVTYTAVGRRNIAETQMYKNSPFVVIPDTLGEAYPTGTYSLTMLSEKEYFLSVEGEFEKKLKFGERFENNNAGFTIRLRNPNSFSFSELVIFKYLFTINDINAQANQYSRTLLVDVNDEKGSILTLSISGFVPQQIADYLNKLCAVYIQSNLDEKNKASINTIQFIDDQLRGIVDSLELTGLRLQQFRSANKVIDISKEGTFLFNKMQDLQSEKAMLDINNRYYTYLQEYIQKRTDFSDVVAPSVIGIQDQLLNKLVSELNDLNLQRRNLKMSLVDNSPQFAMLNNEIVNTRNALLENLNSLVSTNNIAMTELNERINRIEKEVQKLPGTERQLINIQREFTINDQIYTFLLEKRAEAGITRASNTADHKTLDIALPENVTLVKPKISMNYLIGLLGGAGIPLMLLLLFEFFDTKITDRNYLESKLRVTIIGNIGHNEVNSEIPVYTNPKSSMAESFRAIRSNLQYILKDPAAKVIAVSSAVSGEGKTYCSVNLASILALAGKKTLIISLDLRRPKVHRIFNIVNEIGISTYLVGNNTYEEVLKETNVKNLTLATAGPVPPNPAELIGIERMRLFIERARKEFDYIIIDTPPIGIVTDALVIKDLVDAFVFVIRHSYSDKQVIDLINGLQERKMFPNICVAINDIQLRGYYGYSYKYGNQYGYGYNARYSQYEDYVEANSTKGNFIQEARRIFGMKG